MTAAYYDSLEALAAKRSALKANRAKHVAEILAAMNDEERMRRVFQWERRTPRQWLRRKIASLANMAGAWTSYGTTPLGGKPSAKELAMRETITEELRTWLAARRALMNGGAR